MENNLTRVLEISSEVAKPFEGLMKVIGNIVQAYHDPVGYPTIGYGHLLSLIKFEILDKYEKRTFDECDNLLETDMTHAAIRAITLSPVLGKPENLFRWAAIADFCFNCGDGNYKISTLRKRVNEEKWLDASNEILKWDKAGGIKLAGLTRRRIAESKFLLINSKE